MSEVVIYKAKDGHVEIDVQLSNETVWLSLNQMAELFGRDKSVISRHLANIFKNNELEKNSVVEVRPESWLKRVKSLVRPDYNQFRRSTYSYQV